MTKVLKLIIQPSIIEHLGIMMYQNPVDVISELVANSWDADAENVQIKIEESGNRISVKDDGTGMTFTECQECYLIVGRDRRKVLNTEKTPVKERTVLGRKGIGKFSGFGIAKKIVVITESNKNHEKTIFALDLDEIRKMDKQNNNEKKIELIEHKENSTGEQGTEIILELENQIDINVEMFSKELSRRFLLPQIVEDFKISVNGKQIPDSFKESMEFSFPSELTDDERSNLNVTLKSDGWGEEILNGHHIYWRVGFMEETIKNEYLRGISIFAHGKVAQKPFYFELTGGIASQHSLEYMTGQVKMDFIDEGETNLISTERQRINLQTHEGQRIKEWGISRIKYLSKIWKDRTSNKRMSELEDKIEGFKERLERLPPTERKTVKSVLFKVASFDGLGKKRFHEWCNSVLTSWEAGRLKELITRISEEEDIDEVKFIEILSEADVLTALNIAEAVCTKIAAINELKIRVISGQLENKVRDYIYEHPWIISPKWERFIKESGINGILERSGSATLSSEDFKGRVDMVLAAGESAVLIEFMRPGLNIDKEHLERIYDYCTIIESEISKITAGNIKRLEVSYIIADSYNANILVTKRIEDYKSKNNILFLTWETLIDQSLKQWQEMLKIIKERNPNDSRISSL